MTPEVAAKGGIGIVGLTAIFFGGRWVWKNLIAQNNSKESK